MDDSSLQAAGFSPQEIQNEKLKQAGFSPQEIAAEAPQPNMKPVVAYMNKNIADANTPPDGLKPSADQTQPQQSYMDKMLQSLEAGWQTSVSGLVWRNKLPDVPPLEHADMALQIAHGASQLAGDVPAMVAGGFLGGAAGTEVPVIGNAIGAAAGMWSAPAAIRQAYIDRLQKGEIKDFPDFWARTMSAGWEGLKAGITGVATEGMGGAVTAGLEKTGASALTQTLAKSGAQVATMTTVGKAMEGQIPKPEDFAMGAIMVAGMHAVSSVLPEKNTLIEKLQNIYAATGMKPDAIAQESEINPVLKQELLSEGNAVPPSLRPAIEPPQPNQNMLGEKPKVIAATIPDSINEQSPVFSPGGEFAPKNEPQVEKPVNQGPGPLNGTQVIGPDGKPLQVYHSTSADFDQFSLEESGKHGSAMGRGVYFSDSPEGMVSAASGQNVRPAYLNLKNMADFSSKMTPELSDKFTNAIENSGTDLSHPDGPDMDELAEKMKGSADRGETIDKALSFLAPEAKADVLKAAGFDGAKSGSTYVAFSPDSVISKFDSRMSPPSGDEPPSARDVIEDKIGPPGKVVKPQSFDSTYAHVVDELDPLKQLTRAITSGEEIPKSEDPYVMFGKATAQSFERARMAVETGPVDFETGKPTGAPSLKQIMEPFKDDPNGFKVYMLSKRTIEVSERGIKTTIPVEAAREYVEENSDNYEDAHRQVVEWNNSGLDDLQKAGVLSKKQIKDIKDKNQEYIPLKAYAEDGTSGGSPYSGKPIKGLKGNENLNLVDPVESMIKNRYAFSRLAEENVAKQTLVDLATKFEAPPELLDRVPTPVKAIKVTQAELSQYLANNGIVEDQGDTDTMKIWRANAQPLRDNQFSVMSNGERQVYQVDPSIAKAFEATGSTTPTPMLLKVPGAIAKGIATSQRIGTTLDPFFLLKHGMRDQFSAAIYSQNGYRPVIDGLRGLGHIIGNTEDWNEFLANGGGMTTISDFHDNYIKDDIWGLSQKTGLIDKAINVIKTPYERMEMIAKAVFNAPKMGEYLRSREAGNDVTTAVDDARNVTPNVMRTGSADWVKGWSAATPFASMRMRGMDQLAKSFVDDQGNFDAGKSASTAAKMAVAITIPSILTWLNGKDDPRYRDAPNWEKDLFWVVPIGGDPVKGTGGVTLRIPKPFEPGLLFGSAFERILDSYFKDRPHAMKGFLENMVGGATPQPIPAFAMPMLEQFGNKSWLTGGNIVPRNLEDVSPQYQYTPYTSETAKAVARLVGYIPGVRDIGPENAKLASPAVVQNYIRGWTGTLGSYALDAIDKGLEKAGVRPPSPEMSLADIPFVKEFVVRNPSAGAQPILDFYDNYHDTKQAMATAHLLSKGGDPEAYQTYVNNPDNQGNMVELKSVAEALGSMSKAVKGIYASTTMKPAEKRQLIDQIYSQMIPVAKEGNAMLEFNRESVKKMRAQ